ncbi:hypothetical protein [Streptomyces sp. NBC_01089]|uniref:hypothetical protein n=1 Tax=Streptomyces sp. NBC_01089 TaxID=2903747 RepID=UPI003870DB3A|nr:hypothetical protein OG510_06690 [Streptomyces sp. NBC_01089]
MHSALTRTALAAAALCATLTAAAITPSDVLHPASAKPSAPRTQTHRTETPEKRTPGTTGHPAQAPGAQTQETQQTQRTEGDTNPPPYDRRAFTEQTVRLTWKGTTAAGRARMCAHPDSFNSPALDARYAARLIRAECGAH